MLKNCKLFVPFVVVVVVVLVFFYKIMGVGFAYEISLEVAFLFCGLLIFVYEKIVLPFNLNQTCNLIYSNIPSKILLRVI